MWTFLAGSFFGTWNASPLLHSTSLLDRICVVLRFYATTNTQSLFPTFKNDAFPLFHLSRRLQKLKIRPYIFLLPIHKQL